ncbi:hypothetical protein B6D52_00970 [Candidatus Parcubacteria bacterium 4484_255]|nr:MAG: hypothetical protein B6D52_00970 [Candidatus Parcubacteria bacterium 4484_255]
MGSNALINKHIDLKNKKILIYTGNSFGLNARRIMPSRPKTADGILRYAKYNIVGLVDSTCSEKNVSQVLPDLNPPNSPCDLKQAGKKIPIFKTIKDAKEKTSANVLIIGIAPKGGKMPKNFIDDLVWALENNFDLVSGMHTPLSLYPKIFKAAKQNSRKIWETRISPTELPIASCQAYKIKKPIVLTIGTDAAVGKLTTTYKLAKMANKKYNTCIIPTGQTSIMIEGWGISVDKCEGDFMAGAVEKMILEKEKEENPDIYFIEGQGSLSHPAFSTTAIALIHGACPTHLVLVHRPLRKRITGCLLLPVPDIKKVIELAEKTVIPSFLNTKVVAISLNTSGMTDQEAKKIIDEIKNKTGLPTTDQIRFPKDWTNLFMGTLEHANIRT